MTGSRHPSTYLVDVMSRSDDVTADLDLSRVCQLLFQSASEGLVVVDAKGVILLHNPRLSEMFGYGPEELSGERIEVLLPESIRGRHEQHRSSYEQRPAPRSMGMGMDLSGKERMAACSLWR